TQNPLEQEGTYPLPEAQLDRFLLHVDVNYPELSAERQILLETTGLGETRPRDETEGAASAVVLFHHFGAENIRGH
ncbi:AAA family ATPase, partial [Rhizobium leguminosarum]|uniref:AAA family ATPase n=1 Tax=Rhizobium leguminosarum TaxID=384 RepID=UPI003F990766